MASEKSIPSKIHILACLAVVVVVVVVVVVILLLLLLWFVLFTELRLKTREDEQDAPMFRNSL